MSDQPARRKPGRPPIYRTDAEREAARAASANARRGRYEAKMGRRVAVQLPPAEAKALAPYGATPLEAIRVLIRLAEAMRAVGRRP